MASHIICQLKEDLQMGKQCKQFRNSGRDFPLHIDWHAQVGFGETFLITGGWGGVQPSSMRELDTIFRLVYNVT